MAELGRFNRLPVARRAKIGLFLDAGNLGQVLLPRRYVDAAWQLGDSVEVFLYHDSEDRVVATVETPAAQVGDCAYLKVVAVSPIGAFLDWGLPKDLLVPFGEQQKKMQKGYSYAVYVYVDPDTQRIVASSKLERHLHRSPARFRPQQQVDLLIYGKSDLGFKAVVDNTHLGQLYTSETFQPLHYGERLRGYIKQVRKDGKIDLVLQLPAHLERDHLVAAIVENLQQNDGVSTLTDRSPPDDIYRAFGVSKANYKKALGQLYRQRVIRIDKDRITLC